MFDRDWVIDDAYKAVILFVDFLRLSILVGQAHAVAIVETDANILVRTVVNTLKAVQVDPSSFARLPHQSSPHYDTTSLESFK